VRGSFLMVWKFKATRKWLKNVEVGQAAAAGLRVI
jgi:hypothetical protein